MDVRLCHLEHCEDVATISGTRQPLSPLGILHPHARDEFRSKALGIVYPHSESVKRKRAGPEDLRALSGNGTILATAGYIIPAETRAELFQEGMAKLHISHRPEGTERGRDIRRGSFGGGITLRIAVIRRTRPCWRMAAETSPNDDVGDQRTRPYAPDAWLR